MHKLVYVVASIATKSHAFQPGAHLLSRHLRVFLHMNMIVRLKDVYFIGGKVNPAYRSVGDSLIGRLLSYKKRT